MKNCRQPAHREPSPSVAVSQFYGDGVVRFNETFSIVCLDDPGPSAIPYQRHVDKVKKFLSLSDVYGGGWLYGCAIETLHKELARRQGDRKVEEGRRALISEQQFLMLLLESDTVSDEKWQKAKNNFFHQIDRTTGTNHEALEQRRQQLLETLEHVYITYHDHDHWMLIAVRLLPGHREIWFFDSRACRLVQPVVAKLQQFFKWFDGHAYCFKNPSSDGR
ncbi:MAG: hypothetical protein GY820_48655 [Gammaproteobacteria bacterium]|nr:hypothetical protein [Gammaproteobacteria bacterium]